MFALAAARDLAIAIVLALVLGWLLGLVEQREARLLNSPSRAILSASPNGAATCRATDDLDHCRAAFLMQGQR